MNRGMYQDLGNIDPESKDSQKYKEFEKKMRNAELASQRKEKIVNECY